MAGALARFSRIEPNDTGIQMVVQVYFTGADTENLATEGTIVIPLKGSEQPAAIRTAISNAIVGWPGQQGYAWTVAPSDIIMPTFQKG